MSDSRKNNPAHPHQSFKSRFRRWITSEHVSISILAFIIGVLAGTGAYALNRMVAFVSRTLTDYIHPGEINVLLLILPLAGILLTGIYTRYILKHGIEHGVDKMMKAISERHYNLPGSAVVSPLIASTLTLGFGGSAGSEGPIAYAGAAIGSNVARICRMSPHNTMILLGCGAAAGIAGIFKAPVGGAMFALEVLSLNFTTASVLAVMVSVIAAGLTTFALTGYTIDLAFPSMATFEPHLLPSVVLLGVLCGVYSIWYTFVADKIESFLGKIRNPWLKNIVSGGIISVLVFVFPALYGEGYSVMGEVLGGNYSVLTNFGPFAHCGKEMLPVLLLGIVAVKSLAATATNSGGGVAGDFAPTLMAGCMLGLMYALAAQYWMGIDLEPGNLAYYGMAGAMAGIIQAPIMAIFIVVEMSGGYTLLMPIAVVATISFFTVKACNRLSIYDSRRRSKARNEGHTQAKHD